jgi:dihydrolipoamide dehydrogenase
MEQPYDVAVIGGGPGGYVAAIRAAQLGFNTVCIDAWKNEQGKPSLGGTCLNVGCIPSKALLESSENYERVLHKFAAHGIKVSGVELDLPMMLSRKEAIVSQLTGGIAYLFKKNKVASLHGHGSFAGSDGTAYMIDVVDGDTKRQIRAVHVIVATGSVPRPLAQAPVDNVAILDNAGALSLREVPKRLGVIGAGVIGLEMGSVWKRLGADVTILEVMPSFLAAADEQVAREALKQLTRQGLAIHLGAKIGSVEVARRKKGASSDAKVTVAWQDAGGVEQKLEVDRLIVAVGRVPNTAGLSLSTVGIDVDERGFVRVDERCRTAAPNVYAVGDVVRGPMLAHKAMEEGVAVAETIAGQHGHVDLSVVPWVIYTAPEVAWVGRTQRELEAAGVPVAVGTCPFGANGRAKGLGETDGFVKFIADAHTDRILGVHVVGPFASELIAEAVVAMEFGASSEDIARIVHAHPSLSEVTHEAALAVSKRALHF